MTRSALTIEGLQTASFKRNLKWDPQGKLTGLFFSTELAGEVGEACNIVKKIEREILGLRGSHASVEDLAHELADVLIVVCLLANHYDIELSDVTIAKFNETSRKLQLPVLL